MPSVTRRQFLECASLAGASVTLPARTLLAASANEQVNLGIVGCGWRGGQLRDFFAKTPGVQIAGLCDPDQQLLDELSKNSPKAKKWIDMRNMFDSSDIDAVVIATCNHWHCLAAIWAMQAGKHVYVEKPLGYTQWEGEQVVKAAVKYDRICQVGTQQRSDPMQAEIKQFLHEDNILGKVESVRVNRFGVRKSIGRRTKALVPPASVDYNLWLGPAQDNPIYRDKLHYDWHWDWNTGSGEMGNWGVHMLDDVRNNVFRDSVAAPASVTAAGGRFTWADAGQTPNVHFAVLDAGGVPVVVALSNLPYDKTAIKIPGSESGYIAYCSGGRLEGQRARAKAFDADGKLIREFKGNNGNVLHQQNFIDAIREHKPNILAAPAHVGNDSTAWCNFINIATRVPHSHGSDSATAVSHAFGSLSSEAILEQLNTIVSTNAKGSSDAQLLLGPTLRYNSEERLFEGEHAQDANRLMRRECRTQFNIPDISI